MKIKKLILEMLTVLALTACTTEDMERQTVADGTVRFAPKTVSDWNAPWTTRAKAETNTTVQALQGADGLYLHTTVSQGFDADKNVTRGTQYTGATFATSETFYVSGYRYASNSNVSTVAAPNFLSSAPVTYVDSEWKATQEYVMPASTDLIDFFAWFVPEGTSGVMAVNAAGGTQLTYAMPSVISEQPDLLTAVKRNESYNAEVDYKVDLAFTHQLTDVNFVLDENVPPATITEIAFINVYTTATLNIGGAWDFTNGTAPEETKYTLNFSTTGNDGYIVGEENRAILSGLMMIPQEFSNTQKIRVKMHIDGEEQPRTLYADLKNTEWEAGTTVTYKISTSTVNALRMGTVNYPTSWSTASTANSDIKSAYAVGDAFGVYAIDDEGTVQVNNAQMTLTSDGWSSDALYTPGYTYFFYYPYQTDGLAHAGKKGDVVVTTAADFFEEGVANWAPAEDQSSAGNLNASDLQIGKGSLASASTVNLTMAHVMGLTSLTLESKSVPTTRYFYVNEDGTVSTTNFINSNESTDVAADNGFNLHDKMLANSSGNVFYYVVRPNAEKEVNDTETGLGQWVPSSVTMTAAGNAYHSFTAHCRSYVYRGWAYTYRGKGQTFEVPANGDYRMECWGAGTFTRPYTNVYINGGGYTAGDITLVKDAKFFVFVGQKTQVSTSYAFNGGGYSQTVGGYTGPTGNGATDIRLEIVASDSTNWNNFNSLLSRIMVAAGAGHSSGDVNSSGDIHSCGGGLTGYESVAYVYRSYGHIGGYGATQTNGGSQGKRWGSAQNGSIGSFGYGGWGGRSTSTGAGSGGGGGYYGGAGGTGADSGAFPAGGGSSYISGHAGCNSVSSAAAGATSSDLKHRGAGTIHYSGYYFTNISMVDGAGFLWPANSSSKGSRVNQPSPTGGSDQIGHNGNGFCRIAATFLMNE